MKIKRLKSIKIGSYTFHVTWDKSITGGSFEYGPCKNTLLIGVASKDDDEIFEILCHELWEIVCCQMYVRFNRGDCSSDYIFVYDHRQHTTMISTFSGLISEFIV